MAVSRLGTLREDNVPFGPKLCTLRSKIVPFDSLRPSAWHPNRTRPAPGFLGVVSSPVWALWRAMGRGARGRRRTWGEAPGASLQTATRPRSCDPHSRRGRCLSGSWLTGWGGARAPCRCMGHSPDAPVGAQRRYSAAPLAPLPTDLVVGAPHDVLARGSGCLLPPSPRSLLNARRRGWPRPCSCAPPWALIASARPVAAVLPGVLTLLLCDIWGRL
jgi:hypothetical protein